MLCLMYYYAWPILMMKVMINLNLTVFVKIEDWSIDPWRDTIERVTARQ